MSGPGAATPRRPPSSCQLVELCGRVGTRAGGVHRAVAGGYDTARRERRGVCRARHPERGRRADGRRRTPSRLGAGGARASRGGPLEIVSTAFDTGGRPKGMARQALELSWPAAAATGAHRFDGMTRIDLAPGESRSPRRGVRRARTASVFSYVTVPAFAAAPLSISNIVVAATSGTLSAPKDFLVPLLPIVPTARREFARTDRFLAFFGSTRNRPAGSAGARATAIDGRRCPWSGSGNREEHARRRAVRNQSHGQSLPHRPARDARPGRLPPEDRDHDGKPGCRARHALHRHAVGPRAIGLR